MITCGQLDKNVNISIINILKKKIESRVTVLDKTYEKEVKIEVMKKNYGIKRITHLICGCYKYFEATEVICYYRENERKRILFAELEKIPLDLLNIIIGYDIQYSVALNMPLEKTISYNLRGKSEGYGGSPQLIIENDYFIMDIRDILSCTIYPKNRKVRAWTDREKNTKFLMANVYGAIKDGIVDKHLFFMKGKSSFVLELLCDIQSKKEIKEIKDQGIETKIYEDKISIKSFLAPEDIYGVIIIKRHKLLELIKMIEIVVCNEPSVLMQYHGLI